MISKLLRRMGAGVASLFIIASVLFFLLRVVPGGPFDTEVPLPESVQQALEKRYGLDQPLPVQYVQYMWSLLKLDLGQSLYYEEAANSEIILGALTTSIWLGLVALVFSVVIGLLLGLISAFGSNWMQFLSLGVTTALLSFPSFFLATVIVWSLQEYFGLTVTAINDSWMVIVPALVIAMRPIGMMSQLLSSELKKVVQLDFHRTAIAKGLSEARTHFIHDLPNSLDPVIAIFPPLFASLLTGSFVVELVFNLPGLGVEFVSSVQNRDYTLLIACALVFSTLLLLAGAVSDVLRILFDPRQRLG